MNEDPQEVELRIRFKFNGGKYTPFPLPNWQDVYSQIRGRLLWRLRDEIKHVGGSDVKIEIVN